MKHRCIPKRTAQRGQSDLAKVGTALSQLFHGELQTAGANDAKYFAPASQIPMEKRTGSREPFEKARDLDF